MEFIVDTKESFNDVLSCLQDGINLKHITGNTYKIGKDVLEFTPEYKEQLDIHDIIYGINKTTNIVNISVKDGATYIFKENKNGVEFDVASYKHWVLSKKKHNDTFTKLAGNQPYQYIKEYSESDFETLVMPQIYKMNLYTIHQRQENFMVKNGVTYFKGMKSEDVSVLSFDIETTGMHPDAPNARLLLITNTYRKNNEYTSKTFCVEDYPSEKEMIQSWCDWVRQMDPSVLLGHNIVMFDIPYIKGRMNTFGEELQLGRLNEYLEIEERTREFRKDGSQTYTYRRINCFGREIIDTFFLAIKADIARKYESYGLKSIIKQEGMEEAGRQHYDAGDIAKNWYNLEERKKIIAYAEADSRDPIKLYDLMIPPFFYLTPYIPKPFQIMIESATGSQLNALMIRSYLQKGHSIAEATKTDYVQGGISFAVPGIYKNLYKVDLKSAYPSQILRLKLYSKQKDPFMHFYKICKYFAESRFEFKRKNKETGDMYWINMDQSAKVIINSLYGVCQTPGLNYNDPEIAGIITSETRKVIELALIWASGKGVDHWMEEFNKRTGK